MYPHLRVDDRSFGIEEKFVITTRLPPSLLGISAGVFGFKNITISQGDKVDALHLTCPREISKQRWPLA